MATNNLQDIHANPLLTFKQIGDLNADADYELVGRPELGHRFADDESWHLLFPDEPGVYVIFISGKVVYVGESSNLRDRMRDLRETRNHTFRRHHGKALFSGRVGFEPATASKCFPADQESELTRHMGEHVRISTKNVWFGRKEIEEYLTAKYSPVYCRHRRRG